MRIKSIVEDYYVMKVFSYWLSIKLVSKYFFTRSLITSNYNIQIFMLNTRKAGVLIVIKYDV